MHGPEKCANWEKKHIRPVLYELHEMSRNRQIYKNRRYIVGCLTLGKRSWRVIANGDRVSL